MTCGTNRLAPMNGSAHILLALVALALGCSLPMSAQETEPQYCAFEVSIRSPTGQPLSDVSVSAATRLSSSPFATVKSGTDGIARICDVPIGTRIDIHVGNGPCGAIVVRDLYPWWLTNERVNVTYDPCVPRDFSYSFPKRCYLIIRVRNERDKPLPGARLTLASNNQDDNGTLLSDQFGRIFRLIHHGETLGAFIEKDGYISVRVELECKPGSAVENEKIVIMKQPKASLH